MNDNLSIGFPQNTEIESLLPFITTESVKKEGKKEIKPTIQATGAVSWRRQDIKYRKNEVFVDVIESVNLLLSAQGDI